jgi:flavin-dependent dehydrogenase
VTQPFHKVVVVGAGPVGLLLAFMLAKRNIEVVVSEADKTLNKQPRLSSLPSRIVCEPYTDHIQYIQRHCLWSTVLSEIILEKPFAI